MKNPLSTDAALLPWHVPMTNREGKCGMCEDAEGVHDFTELRPDAVLSAPLLMCKKCMREHRKEIAATLSIRCCKICNSPIGRYSRTGIHKKCRDMLRVESVGDR